MIRTLKKKFVMTAMSAITVLLLLLLGAINIANFIIVGNGIERNLQIVSENESRAAYLIPRPHTLPPGPFLRAPKNEYDTFMSSNFFVVRFDRNGSIVSTDTSRTSAVTEDEAETLSRQVYKSGKESGKTGTFYFMRRDNGINAESALVFLDVWDEYLSYIRVLLLSVAIGLICWGLMLIFVILLSRKMIRPIAENMERQKQFVTNAGHEIKTPLAIIQSNTEALELYNGESKWSKNIKAQTVRLHGLMKDLLLLARMDEGALTVSEAHFSFSSMLKQAVQGFVQPMEDKAIYLQADIQSDISLEADPIQIEQLLSILLDNAVKYTNHGGSIQICLTKKDKKIKLQIQNTCETLPHVTPEKLFDRFYRADDARTQKNGGYGIGLAVARSIVSANHGTIQAVYIAPQSICFTVRF